jgi:hypothetical protein
MRARLCIAIAVLAAALAGPSPAPGQTTEEEQTAVFLAYARLRDDLYLCQMGRVQGTLTSEEKRHCRRRARRYVLYAWVGEGYFFHVHCLTRRCPATPEGEPPADGPYPEGATVYRWPEAKSSRHRHRHRRRH